MLQFDDLASFEILFEIQNVPDVGAAETVDRLIVVSDHAQVSMTGGQQVDQLVLRMVGILIFINQNILKPRLIFAQDIGIFSKQAHRFKQNVIKIHAVGFFQFFLIKMINLSDLA